MKEKPLLVHDRTLTIQISIVRHKMRMLYCWLLKDFLDEIFAMSSIYILVILRLIRKENCVINIFFFSKGKKKVMLRCRDDNG